MSCLKELKILGWNGHERNTLFVYNLLKSLQDLARSLEMKVFGSTAIDLYNEHKSKLYIANYNENTIVDILLNNENENIIEHLQKTFIKIENIELNNYKVDNMFILRFHHTVPKLNLVVTLTFWGVDMDSVDTKTISNYIHEDFNYTFFHH